MMVCRLPAAGDPVVSGGVSALPERLKDRLVPADRSFAEYIWKLVPEMSCTPASARASLLSLTPFGTKTETDLVWSRSGWITGVPFEL
jgi:hypothetical protein